VAERFRRMRETANSAAVVTALAVAPESEAHAARQSPVPYGANDE
jgi:hypothetical protein